MLVKLENDAVAQFPYSLGILRAENPRVSIPSEPSEAILGEFNAASVDVAEMPVFNGDLQKITQKTTPEKRGSKWVLGWDIVDLTESEKKANIKGQQKPLKRTGVNLGGVMASATRDDQNGLTAISVGVIMARSAGNTFPDTLFQFVNGNELLITDANFDGYFATWSAFRQGFFAP